MRVVTPGRSSQCVDGNEATASVAYRLSEIVPIYPITPASPMSELADAWSNASKPNIWGDVPRVIQMQSEAGAAGALHGALQRGSPATTFTASQGLLLMLPNMFKLAGELTPVVIHVAARTVATHALSIFGDHSDVMTARTTGFAMLSASSCQAAHDLALVAHAATFATRVPFIHFLDGFRTSHEVTTVEILDDSDLAALMPENGVLDHRLRGLTPDRPVLRGSSQNPDVFFQSREAVSPFYGSVERSVLDLMKQFEERTGRRYRPVEYSGAPDADCVVVAMGSATETVSEAVRRLRESGERVGMIRIRLFRPFPTASLAECLPTTVKHVAVLDRTKEPGSAGEPLYQDVVTALAESGRTDIAVTGGRYGLSSKEFTPAMACGVFAELRGPRPKVHFTVGINDDVSRSSIDYDPGPDDRPGGMRALFYGMGSDGTVGAIKSTVKIVAEETNLHPQAYFVYDSKKAGSITVSHLRIDRAPFEAPYAVQKAGFVGCHRFDLLERIGVLAYAEPGATLLLNTPHGLDTWAHLPSVVQQQIVDKQLDVWMLDAHGITRRAGLGGRVNTAMQIAFFAVTSRTNRPFELLSVEDAAEAVKSSLLARYGVRGGREIVKRNVAAMEEALADVKHFTTPDKADGRLAMKPPVSAGAPAFVRDFAARLVFGEGDELPVSAMPVDGTFPTGTARWEKRTIAHEIPIWEPELCIDCAHCTIACPHAAIRMKVYDSGRSDDAPDGFRSKPFGKHNAGASSPELTIQVAPDDCTGCGICVDVCPARSKTETKHKALNMTPIDAWLEIERSSFRFFQSLESVRDPALPVNTVKGSQVREPLFEFSGACAGCGETPYLKLLTQMFGDRLLVANATGCSSIYGGNLPTTPWGTLSDGRGPAWSNSLFEDNAEFGLGMRLALDVQADHAKRLLRALTPEIGDDFAAELIDEDGTDQESVDGQRERIAELRSRLDRVKGDRRPDALELESRADDLARKTVWIVGGDGWAYDIGSAGVDHVLASGKDVNLLVLDTEVYSNTGGQASKATPRGAVAKFAAGGKTTPKKDLGMQAAAYGNVYVAQIALGASYPQTVKAFSEAEAWPGPSIIIAYSHCIAHGIDMSKAMTLQREMVKSGYWPLYRFVPGTSEHEHPLKLDSRAPTEPLERFEDAEARFGMLKRVQPDRYRRLLELAKSDVSERRHLYEQLAGVERTLVDSADTGEQEGDKTP